MERSLFEIFNILALATVVILSVAKTRYFNFLIPFLITILTVVSSLVAILVMQGGPIEYSYAGSSITGEIPIRIDYLSAWFIIIISFTFLTGMWYGIHYMKKYRDQSGNIVMHAVAFVLAYVSLIDICAVQNSIVFLTAWEIMALSSFILIIFEHYKTETLKAGINFLIQSHVSILFLTVAFIWIRIKTGSFDLIEISSYTALHPYAGIILFILLFTGFAIKAGFVPFHTWLPMAHPAAPAHVSGIMSGVIIKIGIFGILRMLTLIQADFKFIGYFILTVSVITGLYGVMLAIVQHNLKKLLAFHSIENIGIIGMGIGLGCLGIAGNYEWLFIMGFGGALLHTLNHSLFKSLLFFSTGNVYQATHTVNIESLGGLMKRMPRTSWLFLAGSVAICGLPPFNGFVSEFFIYSGLFRGLASGQFLFSMVMLFSIIALVLIGGLAFICFTKAFGIVFLGTARDKLPENTTGEKPLSYIPLYIIASAMLAIGGMPFLFSSALLKITGLFGHGDSPLPLLSLGITMESVTITGLYSLVFIFLAAVVILIRRFITRNYPVSTDITWGCGYMGVAEKAQYTASSFIRTYRKLIEPVLLIRKDKKMPEGLYPVLIEQVTHPEDKIESMFIDKPANLFRKFLNRFLFLQNGNIQSYILYGFMFLAAAFLLTFLMSKGAAFTDFLNRL